MNLCKLARPRWPYCGSQYVAEESRFPWNTASQGSVDVVVFDFSFVKALPVRAAFSRKSSKPQGLSIRARARRYATASGRAYM